MSYRLVVSSRAVGRQILSDRKCCRTFFDHLKRTFKSFTAILHSVNGSTTTTSRISDQIEKSESRSEKGSGSGIDNDSRSHVEASDKDIESLMVQDMLLFRDFLSVEEEQSLLDEVEPYLKRLKYEYDHWDNAIHGFRETERKHWSSTNKQILERVKTVAFPPPVPALAYVHLLDLAQDGYIKPHIDAVRFCGNTIAGLSLLSPCVMKLVHDKEKEKFANVILPQRSLYIMRGRARYDFTHEVLSNDHSSFKGEAVHKGRRISVICRNEPTKEDV